MVPFAHASDGGGSIRIPASCCGLVGLKPSQGRITLGPVRDESGLGVEHCVSRTVRDTAALLDATRGPGIGDTVIAPPPTRPYVDELGADPGRLRIGILDHHPQGGAGRRRSAPPRRGRSARLLESLGHHVEPAWPTALEDKTFGSKFGALWSTNMGVARRRFEDQLGRPLEDREFEPMNRVQADFASHFSPVDYALGTVRRSPSTGGRCSRGGTTAGICCSRRRSPSCRSRSAPSSTTPRTRCRRWRAPASSWRSLPRSTSSGQPAISLPLEWTADGLPVGVQLVAAYGREDVLFRVASQLEQANPWAHRTPGVEMQ